MAQAIASQVRILSAPLPAISSSSPGSSMTLSNPALSGPRVMWLANPDGDARGVRLPARPGLPLYVDKTPETGAAAEDGQVSYLVSSDG